MKSKTVCFFRLSPTCIFQPTLPSFIRVNGHYKHHTALITRHKFENLHELRKLNAQALLLAAKPSST